MLKKYHQILLILGSLLLVLTCSASAQSNQTKARLSPEEQAWLQAHPVIRLAPDPEFRPIEFFDEKGSYDGIGADFVSLLSRKLGIRFEIVRYTNWDDVLKKAQNREVDLLNAVVQTPQREEFLIFPSAYLKIPSVIIARKTVNRDLTLEMLRGMQVVMVSGYGYVDLIRNKYPDIQIELVPDLKTALRKVSFGMADAFVGDLATASYYIEQEGISNLKLVGETDPPNISGFAVRSDWPELASILEKGIALITEEEKQAIYRKWIHLSVEPLLNRKQIRNIVAGSVALLFVLLSGFLLWTRTLNLLVRRRTRELQQEISERMQVEQALRQSEQRFKDLVVNSTDWIWEFNENEIFTYSSPRIKDLLGYDPEEIVGQSAYSIMEPEEAVKVQRDFVIYKEARAPFSHLLNRNRHKDGREVYLESSGVPIIDEQGVFHGYRGIDRDITERIRMEEHLRQSFKMEAMGTLAGGIAHDFNNILSAIIGYADMARHTLKDDAAKREYMEEVLQAGHRAKELVRQILTFSRKGSEEMLPLQPAPVVREALKLMRASIPSSIEIREEIDPACGTILANPTQLHQVVVNLFTNAMQAIRSEQGVIQIRLSQVRERVQAEEGQSGESVCLCVKDSGEGMEEAVLSRIFEPYFTTKPEGQGSGIGLAVVHGIVHKCGGHIRVESSPGSGTEFQVFFPLAEKPAGHHVLPADMPDNLQGDGEKILVVDDEDLILDVFRASLSRLGYEVVCEKNPLSALERIKTDPEAFDLIITDQTMPGLTGYELARQILNIRPDASVMLCSGYSNVVTEETALAAGIKRFLAKPLSIDELGRAVYQVLHP